MLNVIVGTRPMAVLASVITCRSDPAPVSLVLVTTNPLRVRANSEVSPLPRSVAVALKKLPGSVGVPKPVMKDALPEMLSVVTFVEPMNCSPWPKPDGSAALFAKNSRRKVWPGVLLSVPATATVPSVGVAKVRTG